MHTIEVLIEENAFGSVRPVEVVADVPISVLVPFLVEKLQLPHTDLFGKELVYLLCQSSDNRILSEDTSLQALGVRAGERLALLSYGLDSSADARKPPVESYDEEDVHSSPTVADANLFSSLQPQNISDLDRGKLPGRSARIFTRRTLFMAGGAALVAGTAAVGYNLYHDYLSQAFADLFMHAAAPPSPPAPAPPPLMPTMARPLLTFTQHQQPVRSLGWSPSGQMLASGADDRQLLLWRPDGTVLHFIRHPASVRALAWSPDGQRLVTGSGTRVTFLNALTGAEIAHSSHRHMQNVTSVAWAGHGSMPVVSGGADRRAIVWDTTNYRTLTTFLLHTTPIEAVCWSLDGQTVASASQGGVVRIWNGTTAQELHGLYQDANIPMRALSFAPQSGRLAVGGDDGIVRFWDALLCQTQQANGSPCTDAPQRLRVSRQVIRSLSWSPDGRMLAVGTDDGQVSLWNPAQSQHPLLTIPLQTAIHCASWSPNGQQIAVAARNVVTVFSLS